MNATPRLGANYIRDTTWFCCLALSVLVPLGDKVMQKHTLLLRQGSSMPTVKISIGHAGLFTICSYARNRDTVRDTFSLIQSTCIMAKIKLSRHKLSCKATWSATARANLSILEPASAIFLAALITSEEFFRGPLPLGKFKERRREKRDGGWSCRGRRHAELPFKDCAHPSAAQACREANLLFVALKIWHNTITKTFPDNGWNKYSLPVSLMIHLGDMLWSTLQEGNNLCFKSKTWKFSEKLR